MYSIQKYIHKAFCLAYKDFSTFHMKRENLRAIFITLASLIVQWYPLVELWICKHKTDGLCPLWQAVLNAFVQHLPEAY